MEDFVAYPSRWRIALLVFISIAFVAAGLWMIGALGPMPEPRRWSPAIIFAVGLLAVAFFGFTGIAWIRQFFDRRDQLLIGSAGIRCRQWSDETIPWSEITDVTTWKYKRQNTIVLHLRDAAAYPGRGWLTVLARANRAFVGGDITISMVGTNRSFEEALLAIERFRDSDRI